MQGSDKLKLEDLSNDTYHLLKYLSTIEVEYKNTKVIIDNQIDISKGVGFGLVKVNKIMQQLVSKKLITPVTQRKYYRITNLGYKIINEMSKEIFGGE